MILAILYKKVVERYCLWILDYVRKKLEYYSLALLMARVMWFG